MLTKIIISFFLVFCNGINFAQIKFLQDFNIHRIFTENECFSSGSFEFLKCYPASMVYKNVFYYIAKDSTKDYNTNLSGWVAIGLGKSFAGPTLETSVSIRYKNNLFTIRYLKSDEFRFNPGGADYDEPPLSFKEIGILYGRLHRRDFLVLSLSAGISVLEGTARGKNVMEKKFERIDLSTVGIPFEARFRLEFGFVGIGAAWYGDINSKKFISGAMFELSFGKFK